MRTRFCPVWTSRSVKCVMSPSLFGVPSTLQTFLARGSCFIGSRSQCTYCVATKFSVAPESRSAAVSALLFEVLTYTLIDMDWRFDKYTRSELIALIKAELIRRWENPALLLLFLRIAWPTLPFPVSSGLVSGI